MKQAVFEQIEAWSSVLPIATDRLAIHTPLNSGPASSLFPFVSTDLTGSTGILYGINRTDNTLIIFDRFSLENANMVIFSKSGGGKSYAAKLEALRLMMTGTDVIIIDPEHEYKALAESVGGSFVNVSLASSEHINPFDIPNVPEDESDDDALKSHIVTVAGLVKMMVGTVSPEEESVLDRAITETYALKDIIPGKDFSKKTAPILADLKAILESLDGGKSVAERLYRFTEGSYSGFVNLPTNVDLKNRLIVFSLRDLEEGLRPIAMYLVLNFIWNTVRGSVKKRVMIVDEAWWLMRYPEGALFLFGLVKRARKYYLGVTTITQDVEDFLLSPYGRPIITNSSLQILLKQSIAMIDVVQKTFNLSEGEKNLLLETPVGQGLFFAGTRHAVIQIVASPPEDKVITTNPNGRK
jgi:type IV secretory pathway VirB4 component